MTITHGTREPVRTKEEWRRIVEGLVGIPVTEGNRIDVLRNGDEIFPAMLRAIDEAERTVDFLTYVYWSGDIAQKFAHTLARRAQDGLRVRILLDAVGSATMDLGLIRLMRDAGCNVERFRPPTWRLWEADHRTHRKVLVCDEAVAFTGGVGIAEEWEGDARGPGEWRDTHFRLRGPAVDGLRASFLSHWFETGNGIFDEHDRWPDQQQIGDALVQVLRSPAQYGYTDMAMMFRALVDLAESCVRLATAYFVPDDDFMEQLCHAVERGVEVELLVPGDHHDKRIVQAAGEDRYDDLLAAGVGIRRYDRTMLHAKIMTVDGLVSFVGSANADHRSMRLNAENNLLVIDDELTATLDRHYDDDLRHASTVEPGQWARRGVAQRAFETVTNLFDQRL
jgi:cardiolipin synthase A/B